MVTSEDMAVLRRITELALAGGWDPAGGVARLKAYFFLIDPEFWKGLGKSLGWDLQDKQMEDPKSPTGHTRDYLISGWLYKQHALMDHIAEGGDVVVFFEKEVLGKVVTRK